MLGVELVADRQTRRPYPRAEKKAEALAAACFENGLVTYPSGGAATGTDGVLASVRRSLAGSRVTQTGNLPLRRLSRNNVEPSRPMTLREFFPHRLRVPSPGSRIPFVLITLLVCASAGDVFAEKPATPNYTMAVWASEKGLPPGRCVHHRAGPRGFSLGGWTHRPSSLRRQSLLAVAASRSASALPSGPVHAIVGSHDGSIWVGFGGGVALFEFNEGRSSVPDRRWRAARRVRDGPGSPGSDLGCDSSRVVQVRQQPLGAGGKSEGYNGAEAFSLYEDRAGHLWVGDRVRHLQEDEGCLRARGRSCRRTSRA